MKKEYKKLLITDLCGRLMSHTIVEYRGSDVDLTDYARSVKLEECKPYLRKFNSMTDEEKEEFELLWDNMWGDALDASLSPVCFGEDHIKNLEIKACYTVVDFFISHHIDYRGFIELGLALEAKEGMYK